MRVKILIFRRGDVRPHAEWVTPMDRLDVALADIKRHLEAGGSVTIKMEEVSRG